MLKYSLFEKKNVTSGEGIYYKLPLQDEFIWIFAVKPSEEELNKLVADFNLDLKTLNNYSKSTHSKRYSTSPFQFVFVDYFLEKNKLMSTKLLFILEKNSLIVVVPQPYIYYTQLFSHITGRFNEHTNYKKRNIAQLLYYFLEEDTEENYDVLATTETSITNIERNLLKKDHSQGEVDKIISLKRELFHMTRRFWASAKIVFAIKKGLTPLVLDPESTSFFDDIYHTFQHQIDIATAQKEMLADALQIYTASLSNNLATISNNINKTMKFLTALTVVLMIPTLIASIYGMNFRFLPLTDSPNGFYWMLVIMIVSLLAGIGYFFKREWV